jgi:hypothetical protein
VLIVIAILELTGTTHWFHKQNVPNVIPSHQNTAATSNNSPASDSGAGGSSDNQPSSSQSVPVDTNRNLIAPTGNFVSNHFPGQNGSSTAESSTCNTTPAAICYIKFTNVNNGDTTQLPSQTTDARGATSWHWDTAKDAHLTSGQWKITAIASLGDQTKTTDDSLKLTIQ